MSGLGSEATKRLEKAKKEMAEVADLIDQTLDDEQDLPMIAESSTAAQQQATQKSSLNPNAPDFVAAGPGFGDLPDGGDVTDPNEWPTVNQLVVKLLDPPNSAYHEEQGMVVISQHWVFKTVGEPHFVNNPKLGRSVLKQNSKLRTHGLAAGLPEGFYRWICGEEDPADPRFATARSFEMSLDQFVRVPVSQRQQ